MRNDKEYEQKFKTITRKIDYLKRELQECEKQLDEANKELDDYKSANQKSIDGVFHRLVKSKARQEALSQIKGYNSRIQKIRRDIDTKREYLDRYHEMRLLLENFHNYGENDYVKTYIHNLDIMLKERKNITYGPLAHVYSDLRERAEWLNEINHPEGPKYEAIACWCAYMDYQCYKLEQESAYKRFLQLGISCTVADGYCRSYFIYRDPEPPVVSDPLGLGDGVPVDTRGI